MDVVMTRAQWVSSREQAGRLLSLVCRPLVSCDCCAGYVADIATAAMGFTFSFTQSAVSNMRQVGPSSPSLEAEADQTR